MNVAPEDYCVNIPEGKWYPGRHKLVTNTKISIWRYSANLTCALCYGVSGPWLKPIYKWRCRAACVGSDSAKNIQNSFVRFVLCR